MTAKEYLQQIRDADRDVRLKQIEIDELESLIESVKPCDGVRVQTSVSDGQTEQIIKLVEKKIELENAVKEIDALKLRAAQLLSLMSEQLFRSLLIMRYFQNKSWDDIAEELSYTYRHTLIVHGRALRDFEKLITSDHIRSHQIT